MEFLIVLAVLTIVVLIVSAPLRRDRVPEARRRIDLAELEAAREAKYREIRDAELDHRTGKLSDADYEAVDGALRAEAVQILRTLDGERARSAAPGNGSAVA